MIAGNEAKKKKPCVETAKRNTNPQALLVEHETKPYKAFLGVQTLARNE
jgi:hypothetical protein